MELYTVFSDPVELYTVFSGQKPSQKPGQKPAEKSDQKSDQNLAKIRACRPCIKNPAVQQYTTKI